jgi:hypothetical protein
MRTTYRGYEIKVTREKCLGGWSMLYYYVMRLEDGWFAVDSFEDSAETVRGMIGHMKNRIDNELAEDDPWMERADRERYQGFLEIVAGEVCLCGHPHDHHEPPNPNFKVGDFREVRGACRDCECRGEVE